MPDAPLSPGVLPSRGAMPEEEAKEGCGFETAQAARSFFLWTWTCGGAAAEEPEHHEIPLPSPHQHRERALTGDILTVEGAVTPRPEVEVVVAKGREDEDKPSQGSDPSTA